jgi:hypothetical protein
MPRNNASPADQVHLAQAHAVLGIAPTPVRFDDSTLWQTVGLERRSLVAAVTGRVHHAVHGRTHTPAGRA